MSQEAHKYPCFKPDWLIVSLAHKDPYTWNKKKNFQKFEKIFEFYPKITQTGVIKNIDQLPIKSRNYAAAYYQTLEEVPGPLVPEKSKTRKNCK